MSPSVIDDVIDRIDHLAATANSGTLPVAFDAGNGLDREPTNNRHPNRRLLLCAAALVTAVVVAGLVVMRDRQRTDLTTAAEPAEAGARLMPTSWPTALSDGFESVHTSGGHLSHSLPSWFLALDGQTAVTARLLGYPLSLDTGYAQPTTINAQHTMINDAPATWRTDGADTWLAVAVEPGRTLLLASRAVGLEQLEALAPAFDVPHEQFALDALPSGWSVIDDPLGLAGVSGNGGLGAFEERSMEWSDLGSDVGADWSVVVRHQRREPNGVLRISSRTVPNATELVERIGQLDRGPTRVDIGAGGVLLESTALGAPRTVLVWASSSDIIAVAAGTGIDADDLVNTARSSRPVSVDEWASRETPDESRGADGFHAIDGRGEVLATGEGDGFRWRVVRSTGPGNKAATDVDVAFDGGGGAYQGQSDLGATVASGGLPTSSSRDERFVVLMAAGPLGLHESTLSIDGTTAPTIAVDDPSEGVAVVFAVFAARTTGETSPHRVTLQGTLPDGTSFERTS